jgi:hypothetical protein
MGAPRELRVLVASTGLGRLPVSPSARRFCPLPAHASDVTLAADTREAVRQHPFLHDALRAGVVNYSAAARYLDVDGETDAVVAALRRFADDVDPPVDSDGHARVTMERGYGDAADADSGDPLLVVGDRRLVPDAGSLTALVARGDVEAATLRRMLGRLATADVDVEAAAASDGVAVVVVDRLAGPDALRAVEDALGV